MTFDPRPTNRGGTNGLVDCGSLLDGPTVDKLRGSGASNPLCSFVDDVTLRIQISRGSYIRTGDLIVLRAGVVHSSLLKSCISEVDGSTNVCASGSILLTSPPNPTRPTAHLTAPTIISACDGIKLSSILSSGGGIFPLILKWNVTTAAGSTASSESLNQARALLEAATTASGSEASMGGSASDGSVSLPPSALPAGTDYVFHLTVATHTTGAASDPVHVAVRKETWPVVALSIDGSQQRDAVAARPLLLQGAMKLPESSCVDGGTAVLSASLQLSWAVSPPVSESALVAMEGGRQLHIKEGTLTPGARYTATLTASFSGDSVVRGAAATVTLSALHSPLELLIAGGDDRHLGRRSFPPCHLNPQLPCFPFPPCHFSQPRRSPSCLPVHRKLATDAALVLDAAGSSSDPDASPPAPRLAATFTWTCVDITAKPDAPCPGAIVSSLATAQATAGYLALPAGTLSVGSVLRFAVGASVPDGRIAHATQTVTGLPGQPPEVHISSVTKLNPASALVLKGGAVSSSTASGCEGLSLEMTHSASSAPGVCSATFSWSVSPAEWVVGGKVRTLTAARHSDPGYPSLVIGPGELPGGGAFTVTLTATDVVGGSSGTAHIVVHTNEPPCCGALVVSPASGGFGTLFTMSAVGFTDDDLPLEFTFSSTKAGGDGSTMLLAGPQRFPEHQDGMLLTGPATLTVRATDALGGEGFASAPVEVFAPLTPSSTIDETAEFVAAEVSTAVSASLQLGDTRSVVQAVASLASLLADLTPTPPPPPPPPPLAAPLGSSGSSVSSGGVAVGGAAEGGCTTFIACGFGSNSTIPQIRDPAEEARGALLSALESSVPSKFGTIEAKSHFAQAAF